jgi:cobalt-precorrin 5A hydrolase
VTRRWVAGIGMSSEATADEVAALLADALGTAGLAPHDLDGIATRQRFADDPRIPRPPETLGIDDGDLIAASEPPNRTVGVPARVAETSALLGAGPGSTIVVPTCRSAHATVAIARLG